MHIFISVFFNSPMGGLHLNILDTLKALRREKHQVTVLCKSGPFSKMVESLGAKTILTNYENINETVQTVINQMNKPFDLIHAHPFHSREVGQVLAKHFKIPFVVTLHSVNDPHVKSYIEDVDALIVVSDWIKDRLVHPKIASSNKVFVVPNGVDINHLQQIVKRKNNVNKFQNLFNPKLTNIVLASRLDDDKAFLIDSIVYVWENILKNKKFDSNWIIAGEGSAKKKLEELAKEINENANKEIIHLVGWQQTDKLAHLYSKADLYIGPGRTVLEAMVFGVPCIALGSKGYIGIVNSDNIFQGIYTNFGGDKTVSTLDTTLLDRDIQTFLNYDKQVIQQLKEISKSTVHTFFDIKDVNAKLLNVYQLILNKGSVANKEAKRFEIFEENGFELNGTPHLVEFTVKEKTRYYISGLIYNKINDNNNASLVSVDFNKKLNANEHSRNQLPLSNHVGYYQYLPHQKGIKQWVLEVYTPEACTKIVLSFKVWQNLAQASIWNNISISESTTSNFFDSLTTLTEEKEIRIHELTNHIQLLNNNHEKLSLESQELMLVKNDFEKQLETLQNDFEKQQLLLNDKEKQLETLQNDFEKQQLLLNDKEKQLETLQNDFEKQQHLLQETQEQLENTQSLCNRRESNLKTLRSKYRNRKLNYIQLQKDLRSLNQEYDMTQLIHEEKVSLLQNVELELKQTQESHSQIHSDNSTLRGEKYLLEEKLKQAYNTASFRVGYEVIQATKSFSKFVRLPKTIIELKKDRKKKKQFQNPQQSTVIQSTQHIDRRRTGCIDQTLTEGISIVTPSYQGEKYIRNLLDSLDQQTFSKEMYEVIIVLNGKLDNSKKIIEDYKKEHNGLNIQLIVLEESGASIARNKAIEVASFKYMVLVDDDDTISSNFLEKMYEKSDEKSIVISQIINVDESGIEDVNNVINQQVLNTKLSAKNPFQSLSSVLTINACKLIPTCYMKQVLFDVSLKSGEDVVYFSKLFSLYKFNIKICTEAIYYRLLKSNSVSRQKLSFDFNIKQRISVIKRLDTLLKDDLEKSVDSFIKSKIHAQIGFMNRYLITHRKDYQKVKTFISESNIEYFPFTLLNKNLAEDLIISYCFTPYVDTSAVVMAKRVHEQKRVVDVIYNKMDKVREQSRDLFLLADDFIDKRIAIGSPSSFSNWNAMHLFCKEALKELESFGNRYKRIYSRAMWPASHFMAFEYKLKHPHLHWSAEFSDPLLFDIHGKERYGKIEGDWHFQIINRELKKRKLDIVDNDNLFFWCEYLPYLFADKLIFTNQHQLDYMVDSFPIQNIGEIIRDKAVIKEHPTLSKSHYSIVQSKYQVADGKVNLAYFGTFYQTRKLNDIIESVKLLSTPLRKKLLIHVFTNTKDELLQVIEQKGLKECFVVNDYVGYFEFLNIASKFDCLIINDAITKPHKKVNPYLPSKLSDYLGSEAKIWALYEEGSTLSQKEAVTYKSEISKINQSVRVLEKLIADFDKRVI
jgi:glycosyltransferase involved in cell wall biosynthesis